VGFAPNVTASRLAAAVLWSNIPLRLTLSRVRVRASSRRDEKRGSDLEL
jgi:hypothetical protein